MQFPVFGEKVFSAEMFRMNVPNAHSKYFTYSFFTEFFTISPINRHFVPLNRFISGIPISDRVDDR